jgi:hypothetical protein
MTVSYLKINWKLKEKKKGIIKLHVRVLIYNYILIKIFYNTWLNGYININIKTEEKEEEIL